MSQQKKSATVLEKFNFVNKVKKDQRVDVTSSRSQNNMKKLNSKEHIKIDFSKQIYTSLVPKVEFDVVASKDGNTSVNLSAGNKNSLTRKPYKNKSLSEKNMKKMDNKPLQYIK